jgi:hypothetical protein
MEDMLKEGRIQLGYESALTTSELTSVSLLLIRRENDKLTQAQSHLIRITPKGINRNVADKVKGVNVATGPFTPFEQGDKLPRIFVFLLLTGIELVLT